PPLASRQRNLRGPGRARQPGRTSSRRLRRRADRLRRPADGWYRRPPAPAHRGARGGRSDRRPAARHRAHQSKHRAARAAARRPAGLGSLGQVGPAPDGVPMPRGQAALEQLGRLGVVEPDLTAIAQALPTPEQQPELWWLLERAYHQVRLDIGRWDAATWLPSLPARSEEHTSELQSPDHLVCRLLLEEKNTLSKML